MYRSTHPTDYDDVMTLKASMESRWASYASTRDLPTLLDDAYDLTMHNYGAVAALEIETDRYTATFSGPRLPVHGGDDQVGATLDRRHATRLLEAVPILDRYVGTEQDRFLERTVTELEEESYSAP